MDAIEDIMRKQAIFSCIEVYAGSGNALDFQLSSYLGYLIGLGYENANFYIVSNDKGYDCLCDFWQNLYNVNVKRLPRVAVTEQPKKPTRPTKVKKADFATIEEIAELLSPNEYPADILKIVNSYKTKQAIMNGIIDILPRLKSWDSLYLLSITTVYRRDIAEIFEVYRLWAFVSYSYSQS